MQLTQHTDLALRLMIDLASEPEGTIVGLPDFAVRQQVSYNHMVKVAQALARHGFVTSHRGRSGGISLARVPEKVTVGEVVRKLEPRLSPVDCTDCRLITRCGLPPVLGDAVRAFLEVLDRRTLASVAKRSEFPLTAL